MFEKYFSDKNVLSSRINFKNLSTNGQSYQFELSKISKSTDDTSVEEAIMETIFGAVDKMIYSPDEQLNQGPIIIWISNNKLINRDNIKVNGLTVIFSPLNEKFIKTFLNFMTSRPGFLRTEGVTPIFFNGLPRYYYKNKTLHNIYLDELFLKEAAILKEELEKQRTMPPIIYENSFSNVYKKMLDMEKSN
ncbi:UNVERIFIED_ORG: hypothetical protein ABIC97_004134 [Peribacillus simplex]